MAINEEKKVRVTDVTKFRLVIGAILFIFTVTMVAFKGIPIYIVAIPGFMLGVDPRDILTRNRP